MLVFSRRAMLDNEWTEDPDEGPIRIRVFFQRDGQIRYWDVSGDRQYAPGLILHWEDSKPIELGESFDIHDRNHMTQGFYIHRNFYRRYDPKLREIH